MVWEYAEEPASVLLRLRDDEARAQHALFDLRQQWGFGLLSTSEFCPRRRELESIIHDLNVLIVEASREVERRAAEQQRARHSFYSAYRIPASQPAPPPVAPAPVVAPAPAPLPPKISPPPRRPRPNRPKRFCVICDTQLSPYARSRYCVHCRKTAARPTPGRAVDRRRKARHYSQADGCEPSPWQEVAVRAMEDAGEIPE